MNHRQHALSQSALPVLALGLCLLAPATVQAKDYWVAPAPTGSDSAAGTESAPFATVGRAQTAAAAGDTVFIKGGTYAFTGSGTVGVSFTKSGSASSSINYFAAPGETPVFDLSDLTPSNRVTGLDVHCNYIHIRGLEVTGVRQYQSGQDSWGVRIQGNNNVLENLNVHHNEAPGIFITSGSNNSILNCDSHHNYDKLESGGSGDGFGCHSSGGGNIISGCRGYDNSDDGFDFINAAGNCTVEKSFSFRNGWVPDTKTAAGNGAGFKAGGYGSPPEVPSTGAATHTVRQCVAFDNRSQGFYANHHPGRINFYNNTAFNNPVNYNMLADSGYPSSHELRNNVAMSSGTAISNLSGGTASSNSWNLSVTVSIADFISAAPADALSPRQAEGSLPDNGFVRLATGSDLIDKGVDVGLPFNGSAPDLGAFESGGTSGNPSSGGTSGNPAATGGSQARGGASSGGTTSAGGTKAAGGAPIAGGTTTAGGTTGGTGAQNRGGRANSGGTAAGGVPTGGGSAAVSGGSSSAVGGAIGSGGLSSQGAQSSGGAATIGNGGTGASVSAGRSGNSGGQISPSGDTGDSKGCGCRVPARDASSSIAGMFALLGLPIAVALRRRARAKRSR